MCYFAFSLLDTGSVIKILQLFLAITMTMTATLSLDKKNITQKDFLNKKIICSYALGSTRHFEWLNFKVG